MILNRPVNMLHGLKLHEGLDAHAWILSRFRVPIYCFSPHHSHSIQHGVATPTLCNALLEFTLFGSCYCPVYLHRGCELFGSPPTTVEATLAGMKLVSTRPMFGSAPVMQQCRGMSFRCQAQADASRMEHCARQVCAASRAGLCITFICLVRFLIGATTVSVQLFDAGLACSSRSRGWHSDLPIMAASI